MSNNTVPRSLDEIGGGEGGGEEEEEGYARII
jgi:hypothetical protein